MQRRCYLALLASIIAFPAYTFQAEQMPWPQPDFQSQKSKPVSTEDVLNISKQTGQSFLNQIFNAENRPDWMKRTDLTFDIQHHYTPVSGIETIQPLYESHWSTLFWQGRLAYQSGDGTGNLGLGYRYLTDSRQFMWGLSAFYDETFHYKHKRLGLGGELFTPYLTFRANYYDAISKTQLVTINNGVSYYERALTGYDASIETPVPYFSWMRFNAQGYHWNGIQESDVNGGQANLRIFPAKQLEVDTGVAYDNNNHGQAFIAANYYLGAAQFIENSASTPHSTEVFASQNLENQRLQKVIRNNNIAVEKSNSTGAGAIIIARGD